MNDNPTPHGRTVDPRWAGVALLVLGLGAVALLGMCWLDESCPLPNEVLRNLLLLISLLASIGVFLMYRRWAKEAPAAPGTEGSEMTRQSNEYGTRFRAIVIRLAGVALLMVGAYVSWFIGMFIAAEDPSLPTIVVYLYTLPYATPALGLGAFLILKRWS